jgi:hypothetical protein
MKPFITSEPSASGKKFLPIKFEGISAQLFARHFIGQTFVGYSMPESHSFGAAWIFQLTSNKGDVLELSSACTQVVGWEEAGSLNVRHIPPESREVDPQMQWPFMAITPFSICAIDVVIFEDTELITQCGLVFVNEFGGEIIVETGVSPGSVSVFGPFAGDMFDPEFPLSSCRRKQLSEKFKKSSSS